MSKTIRIHLKRKEKLYLQKVREKTQSRRLWGRVTGLIMLADGATTDDVCSALSVSRNTVTNWKHRWQQRRSFHLQDAQRSGRPAKANNRYMFLLRKALTDGPIAYGYIFTVWSAGRLAEHLYRKTKIRLTAKSLRRLLKKLGYVYRRPKHTLKGRQNPKKVRASKRQIESLKKGL